MFCCSLNTNRLCRQRNSEFFEAPRNRLTKYMMTRWRILFLLLLFLQATPPVGAALPDKAGPAEHEILTISADRLDARRKNLDSERKTVEELTAEVRERKKKRDRKLALLQNATVTETTLEQARLAMESAKVNVQSASLDLANEKQQVQTLQDDIITLQHQIDAIKDKQKNQTRLAELQKQTALAKSLLPIDLEYTQLLATHLGLLQKKADLAESWWQSMQAVFQQQQQIRHQESLEDMQHRLQQQEQKVQEETARLQQELTALEEDDPQTPSRRELLQKKIEGMNEALTILKTRIQVQAMKSEHDGMDLTGITHLSVGKLQADMKILKRIAGQLKPMISLTTGRLDVFQQQWTLLQKQYALKNISEELFTREKKILTNLIEQFNSLLSMVQSFNTQIQQDLNHVEMAYGTSVRQSLTARQSLPHEPAAWKNVLVEFSTLPSRLQQLFTQTAYELFSGWTRSSPGKKIIISGLSFILLLLAMALGRLPIIKDGEAARELHFSVKTKIIGLSLLRSCRFWLLSGGILLTSGWIFQIEPTIFRILLLFTIVGFALQVVVKLSYWIFISPLVPLERRQPQLHHMVLWVSGFSALFALLVGLGNIGIFSIHLRDVIDRLFMLLLLPVVYFFLHLRAVLVAGIHPEHKGGFWVHLVALASFSIPLTVLSAAIVGLAGYINLAWFVAGKLALFLLVVIAWIVVRDLVKDLLETIKLHLEKKALEHNLPASMPMASLERVTDLLLFLVALWFLAWLYGWGRGSAADSFLKIWLNHPLFHLNQQAITLANILTSIFLFVLFLYIGSLVRYVTYAWLYGNIRDRGLRNSLSVFTQYAVLVIGALVALNSLGINLTSLTIFAGALGVGIGFGLQNIANNLISGLILLAERPIREEDWVTVGTSQGIVSRIGLRSLVLTTWDNQNVIIPNAELISNPVTNWTLSDNLIRTVFEVGVRYQDDPHKAREVILEAVSMVPEVSLERKPGIYLTEFANSSVNFQVDFFSKLDNQHSRLKIKSKVMFAIWDALKEADIGIPFPQRDIHIKEMPMRSHGETSPLGHKGQPGGQMDNPGREGP